MDFSLSGEQQQLRDSVRGWLKSHHGFEHRRAISRSESGWDAATWTAFADDLGILSLADIAVPHDAVTVMVVMEELGEALITVPFLETVVTGAAVLRAAGGEAAQALSDGIIAGDVRLALAWAEPDTRYGWQPRTTRAVREGNGWRLDGLKSVVVGAPWATHLIVSALTDTGTSLFVVAPDAIGVSLMSYPTIDGRRAADVRFEGVVLSGDALLGEEGAALPVLERVGDISIAAMGAEAVGVMRRMLADTIEYTGQRKQFGQPIASFQVLQHRMVDMFMQIEMATSAVYLATLRLEAEPAERARAASVAKVTIGEACRFVGQNAVQLHGGMGMTDDAAVSHYFKRATVIEGEFGTTDHHVERFISVAG
ncbi:acyl-CoA dehydrogenase short-chain specific [Polymorphobacter glacialis]|uniref:Acyl-CoA dehydrogenase short-chain specific n=1 Tax=Sandarakinorhabdus glacialis TaxID=1614636 RepID=A0A916ZJ15_9SPHN|nr:acyl-CoA dehydrogenase family protein [Polymorphobacter glacialis]GGE00308.1 acyl-CoA dehydrogenase short-chain specific [Polymorphobacter glacialis]